jgi:hypothetical protein
MGESKLTGKSGDAATVCLLAGYLKAERRTIAKIIRKFLDNPERSTVVLGRAEARFGVETLRGLRKKQSLIDLGMGIH